MKGGIIVLSNRLVSYTGFKSMPNGNRGKDKNTEDHNINMKIWQFIGVILFWSVICFPIFIEVGGLLGLN
jgi:hypothetical protein